MDPLEMAVMVAQMNSMNRTGNSGSGGGPFGDFSGASIRRGVEGDLNMFLDERIPALHDEYLESRRCG
jgi:hypothetical protein